LFECGCCHHRRNSRCSGNSHPTNSFRTARHAGPVALILDEIQSGYGRTGKFFRASYLPIKPDLINRCQAWVTDFHRWVLITRILNLEWNAGYKFGGIISRVLRLCRYSEVIESENLMANASMIGNYWMEQLKNHQSIKEVRGLGLMIVFRFT